jgi:ABC-type dipeptide/oligopeptide/nickel transport system permease subunit
MEIEGTAPAANAEPGKKRVRDTGWLRFARNPTGIISLILFLVLGVSALFAPWLDVRDPVKQFYGDELYGPNAQYWFGTDDFGRDIFSRCVWGMRLSLSIGLLAAVSAGMIGTSLGMLQGFLRGWFDELIGRIWDTLLAFPGLLLGLAVAIFLGEGSQNAAIASALINIPIIARISRATVLGEQEKDYAMAARAAGANAPRILGLHLFPNVFPIVTVQITLTVAHAMILEAGLSFLGIGAQPPFPSLGGMLRDARLYMNEAVWYAIFPGLSLTVLLVLITYISDALADAFDPRRQMGAEKA